jgi:hypothetical protein
MIEPILNLESIFLILFFRISDFFENKSFNSIKNCLLSDIFHKDLFISFKYFLLLKSFLMDFKMNFLILSISTFSILSNSFISKFSSSSIILNIRSYLRFFV